MELSLSRNLKVLWGLALCWSFVSKQTENHSLFPSGLSNRNFEIGNKPAPSCENLLLPTLDVASMIC